jgi:very-short-patch-repair endonuclease
VGETVPQDPHLLSRARRLRKNGTPFEAKLWPHLSRSQLGGYKFRRQHVIGSSIVDFFCPQTGLIVEVDGDTHDADKDARRDQLNQFRGYATLRFTNDEVGKNVEGVLERVLTELGTLSDRWPHPNPSPEGEGK